MGKIVNFINASMKTIIATAIIVGITFVLFVIISVVGNRIIKTKKQKEESNNASKDGSKYSSLCDIDTSNYHNIKLLGCSSYILAGVYYWNCDRSWCTRFN